MFLTASPSADQDSHDMTSLFLAEFKMEFFKSFMHFFSFAAAWYHVLITFKRKRNRIKQKPK